MMSVCVFVGASLINSHRTAVNDDLCCGTRRDFAEALVQRLVSDEQTDRLTAEGRKRNKDAVGEPRGPRRQEANEFGELDKLLLLQQEQIRECVRGVLTAAQLAPDDACVRPLFVWSRSVGLSLRSSFCLTAQKMLEAIAEIACVEVKLLYDSGLKRVACGMPWTEG